MRTAFIAIFFLAFLPADNGICAEVAAYRYFKLDGNPTIVLTLDCEYICLETKPSDPAKKFDARTFMFTPTDGGSSLIFQIGPEANVGTKEMLKKTNGVKRVTKKEGQINGNKIEWLHGTDAENRLYSAVTMILKDASGTDRTVAIWIVGSTKERREALENCLADIKLLKHP